MTLAQARVLMALVAVHRRDGRATVRAVAALAGLSTSNTWLHLRHLQSGGWVTGLDGKYATVRPLARWEPVTSDEQSFGETEVAGTEDGPGDRLQRPRVPANAARRR